MARFRWQWGFGLSSCKELLKQEALFKLFARAEEVLLAAHHLVTLSK